MQYSQLYVNHMIPTYQSSNIDTPSISPRYPRTMGGVQFRIILTQMSPVEEPCSGAQQPLERTSEVELGKGVVPPHRHDPQRCGTVCGERAAQNSIGIEEISQQKARERETCTRVSEERG